MSKYNDNTRAADLGTSVVLGNAGILSRHGVNSPYVRTICGAWRNENNVLDFVDIDISADQLRFLKKQVDESVRDLDKTDVVDEYFKLQNEIYQQLGYVEDWVTIPMEDRRNYFWNLEQDKDGRGRVQYSEKPLPQAIADGSYYEDIIYTQRFLPKWVYTSEKYTMICVDTQTDGNKFLAIFDNAKEQKELDAE